MELNNREKRQLFMDIFRSEDFHEIVTPDDCVEIFQSVLVGSSDLTVELLNGVLNSYCVGNISVIDCELEDESKPLPKYYLFSDKPIYLSSTSSDFIEQVKELHGSGINKFSLYLYWGEWSDRGFMEMQTQSVDYAEINSYQYAELVKYFTI